MHNDYPCVFSHSLEGEGETRKMLLVIARCVSNVFRSQGRALHVMIVSCYIYLYLYIYIFVELFNK